MLSQTIQDEIDVDDHPSNVEEQTQVVPGPYTKTHGAFDPDEHI